MRELERAAALLWRTDAVRHVRLQPLDEIKMGIYYLDEILYSAVPELYAELEQLLSACYPQNQLTAPAYIRFGSSIGADQDGNPNIAPGTLLAALHLQRSDIIERYRSSLQAHATPCNQY